MLSKPFPASLLFLLSLLRLCLALGIGLVGLEGVNKFLLYRSLSFSCPVKVLQIDEAPRGLQITYQFNQEGILYEAQDLISRISFENPKHLESLKGPIQEGLTSGFYAKDNPTRVWLHKDFPIREMLLILLGIASSLFLKMLVYVQPKPPNRA